MPALKLQEIIDRLTVLGLDQDQAAVYVHLSMMGPSKASDVAAALRMHRTETYRTLQDLVQRGFASSTLSRPARFQASPPEALFQEILAAQQTRNENIERARTEIAPALTTLRQQEGGTLSKNSFKVLQGRREIYSVFERLLREAQRTVRILTTHEGELGMADMAGLLDLLGRRAEEGVDMRLLLRATPAAQAKLALLSKGAQVEVRHLDSDRIMRFALADDNALLIWVVSDPSSRLTSEDDVAVWTDATDFVGTQSVLFDAAWREGKDLRKMQGIAADHRGVPPA